MCIMLLYASDAQLRAIKKGKTMNDKYVVIKSTDLGFETEHKIVYQGGDLMEAIYAASEHNAKLYKEV